MIIVVPMQRVIRLENDDKTNLVLDSILDLEAEVNALFRFVVQYLSIHFVRPQKDLSKYDKRLEVILQNLVRQLTPSSRPMVRSSVVVT